MLPTMNEDARDILRHVVLHGRIASLGTLHRGEPSVSMVPYAVLPDGTGLVIHVSRLSAHTADMQASARVSIMVVAQESPEVPAQALPRVSIQGDARQIAENTPEHTFARLAYLSRFPESAPIFNIPDFSLFAIVPASVRVIGGFGRAHTVSADDFRAALTAST
jgi:putative heme iron utilization protein